MALSPYLKPSALNGGLTGAGTMLTGSYMLGGQGKDFDKREAREFIGNATFSETISNIKTVAEMLTNTVGTRSPYYTIGEIQSTETGQTMARYVQNSVGNVVRAITSLTDSKEGKGQTGVIIDGFGDVTGTIDVEFSKSPVVFAPSITDNKIRTPNTVIMTVFVSNYYNDDGLGAAVDYITAYDPTGIVKESVNILTQNGNTRAQQALYNLRRIQENGRPFRVYTPHGVYENMAIKTIQPRTTAENVDMLECEVTFQELVMYEPFVDSGKTTYPERTNILTDDEASTNLLGRKWSEWGNSVKAKVQEFLDMKLDVSSLWSSSK